MTNESGVRGTLNTTKHHAIITINSEEDQSDFDTPSLDDLREMQFPTLEKYQRKDLIPHIGITEKTNQLNHGKRKQEKEIPNGSKQREVDYGREKGKRTLDTKKEKIKKVKQFREPKEKENHNWIFYDISKMPLKSLFESFGNWEVPDNFTASKFKIKVTEDSTDKWTAEHDWDVGTDSDMWKHFGHLKFENTNKMKVLGVLSMYDAYIEAGVDYVIKVNKEKVWGNDKDMVYLGFNNLKTALFGSYCLGGAAVSGCFLGALSNHSGFRMQFSNPGGDYAKLNINWENAEWYKGLKEVLKMWITANGKTTHGKLRRDLLKRRFDNDQKCLKTNEIPLNISQNMVPMHPDNLLNPMAKTAIKLKPSERIVHRWKLDVQKGNFNLVNDTGNLIRFFRPFKDKNAEKEVDYQKKLSEIQDKNMKAGGMNDNQLGRFKSTRRRTTMNKLRQISVTNNFLKSTDRESNLHKGFAYIFMDVEQFGTLDEEELFIHLMQKEKERCPTNFMNDYNSKNPEDAVFKQMWANCGGEAPDREWLMKLLHFMKKNHDKQMKALQSAIHKTAAFAAETRNIMMHRTSTNSLKGDLALHLISGILKRNGGEGVSGYGNDNEIEEVSDMLKNKNKMESTRDGGIPTIYKGEEILRGKKKRVDLIKNHFLGDHYNTEASGLNSKDENVNGLTRKRSKNSLLTGEEQKANEDIEKYKRRRLQECDFNPKTNPNFKIPLTEPKPEPKPPNNVKTPVAPESDTCEKLKNLSELGISDKPTDKMISDTNEDPDDVTEKMEEPSTMTGLSDLIKADLDLDLNTEEKRDSINSEADSSPIKPTYNVAIESPKANHDISCGGNDEVDTPKKNEKRAPDRTVGRIQLAKANLMKNNGEEQTEILKKINISDAEIASYNFSDPRYKPEEEKGYKFRQGVSIQTMKTFKWSKKWIRPKANESVFQLKITMKAARETWYQYVIKYTQLLLGLLKVFRKILTQKMDKGVSGVDLNFLNECNGMVDDLDGLRRLLDLDTTIEKFKELDRGGIEYIPLPSIALYTAVEKFLPIAAQKADFSLNQTPKLEVTDFLTQTHAKRLKKSKITITTEGRDGSIIEDKRQGKEFLTNNQFLYFDELEEKIEVEKLYLQTNNYDYEDDYSTISTIYENSFKNELDDPIKCNIIRRPHSTPKKNRIKVEEKTDEKTTIKVSFTEGKCKIGDEPIENDFLGFKLNKNVKNEEIKCLKDAHTPRFINEKVRWKYADALFQNFTPTSKEEIQVSINNFTVKTTPVFSDKKALRSYPLQTTYVNINPPVHIKLKNLINEFPTTSFFCVVELMQKAGEVLNNAIIPLGYKPITHKPGKKGLIYAMIVHKAAIDGEINVIYDECPFVLITYKNEGQIIGIGTFYRPHDNSVIYEQEFGKDDFKSRYEKFIGECKKIPTIIMGDVNLDFSNTKGLEQRRLKTFFDAKMARFTKIDTGPTFLKNEKTNTTIDHVWYNRMITPKVKLYNGRTLIGNDGHAIINTELHITMNGVIGETKIKSRPKLDKKTVNTLGGWIFQDLKEQLDMKEEIIKNRNSHLKTPNKADYDDNEYCELAFDFFENFFAKLQPEEEKTIKIYNNRRIYSKDIAKLNIIAASLSYDLKNEKNETEKENLKGALKSVMWLRNRGRKTEERTGIIGRFNANEDDIHTICKSLRPKLRGLEITKEIFTADQLIQEFVRVYENVVRHVDESKVVVNVIDMFPRFEEAMKFSFKNWIPTWDSSLDAIKTIEQCFNQLKPVTRGLNSSLYRDGIAMLPVEYCEILNKMILYWVKEGNYPKKFLSGKLKAILKKGDPSEIKNRRFISVGNFFQQLLGKVVASCLLAYCEKNNLLDQDQFGFRTKRSCDQAVAQLMHKVGSKHSTTITAIIMLDLSSAFFCVKKELLIEILGTFINRESMVFFKQMLRPIKAKVISDGIESDEKDVPDYGVRQGDGCSPLFFNITINKLYEYVRIKMESRYDKESVQIQGFADDSILIITATTPSKLNELIKTALRKTNEYVTSVGFKINASKSEIMLVSKDKSKKDAFGEYIETEMGDIEIKNSLNILGLRIDSKLSFEPQFNHLMSKVGNLRRDTLELIGMDTNRQILKNAFARSNGIYMYGIGIQKKWKQSQYRRAQREVNDLIRLVYNIKWQKEKSWSQRDLLRMARWPPVRIQHEMAALLFLNKIAMAPQIEYLFDTLNHHLRFPNGDKVLEVDYKTRFNNFLRDPLTDDWIPKLKQSNDDIKFCGPTAKNVFPLHAAEWFNNLPNFIKCRIGTKGFEEPIQAWFQIKCWCRAAKDCSKCKKRFNANTVDFVTIEREIELLMKEENSTLEEWTKIASDELNSFMFDMTNENEETFLDYFDEQGHNYDIDPEF